MVDPRHSAVSRREQRWAVSIGEGSPPVELGKKHDEKRCGVCSRARVRKGTRVDPLTEEEPGRILHEVRLGREAALALGRGARYYGTVEQDALLPTQEQAEVFSFDEFVYRVAQRCRREPTASRSAVEAVLATLREAVKPGEFDDVLGRLHRDFDRPAAR